MKKIIIPALPLCLFACSKKDFVETETTASETYQLRIAALESNGNKSYTSVTRVKSGRVAVEFETADASGIQGYNVEISSDGTNFRNMKTINADLQTPNRLYRDTIVLE